MTTIRSLIFFVALALSVVFYSVLLLLAGSFISYDRRCKVARSWSRVVLFFLKAICGLDHRIRGIENLPDGAAIAMVKHQSAWETIALRSILPLQQIWVLKQELLHIPLFGSALALFEPIAIDRSAGRSAIKQLIREGERWLDRGRWVIVFPEGTRVAPGDRRKYGVGGALLAERTGYPVVPIAHNAGVFWARRSLKKYPGRIDVMVGPQIATKGRSASEINQDVENWIESVVEKLPMTRYERPGPV